jgi:AcrR family transcriptional regulator
VSSQLAEARTPSQQARREAILAAALGLLEGREYEEIQVREVAEEAGVALGTLYRYFPSKELLYGHALLAWSDAFESQVQASNRSARSDADRLRAALRRAVRAYERYPTFLRLLNVLEVATEPGVRDVFAAFSERFHGLLLAALADTDERDAETIAAVAASVLGTSLRSWAQHGTPIRSVYGRIDSTVTLLFEGPRPRR